LNDELRYIRSPLVGVAFFSRTSMSDQSVVEADAPPVTGGVPQVRSRLTHVSLPTWFPTLRETMIVTGALTYCIGYGYCWWLFWAWVFRLI
jgi:hypothetical protein